MLTLPLATVALRRCRARDPALIARLEQHAVARVGILRAWIGRIRAVGARE